MHYQNKLVEAVKMPFQDALSHGRWRSAPRIGGGNAQSRSATDLALWHGGLVR